MLNKAFEEASKLDETEQDAVGRWLLEKLASDRSWDEAFAHSQDALRDLAAEAIKEHRSGRTYPLDPDTL